MTTRILVVEDDPGIVDVLTDLLGSEGYATEVAFDAPSGIRQATEGRHDLLILDVMLPGGDGYSICRAAREHGFEGAILMLTARGQSADRVRGLKTGADDYLVKPWDADELLARIEALLRRVHKVDLTPVTQFKFGAIAADFSSMSFHRNGVKLSLAAKEAELLRQLINHRHRIVSRERLLELVWNDQPNITIRTVDVHVAWLRKKLEENPHSPRHIQTVRGEGYRFVP